MTRYLPAAVLAEDDPRAANAARVVPAGAKFKKVGTVTCGYVKPKRAGRGDLRPLRLAELKRIIAARHGREGVDTDDGTIYAAFAFDHLLDAPAMREFSRRFTPLLTSVEVESLVTAALTRPRRYTADAAGRMLMVTRVERERLKLRTIGAVDHDARARKEQRQRTDRDAKRAKRAAEPKRITVAAQEPWTAFGWSRRTWYRRGRPMPDGTKAVGDNLKGQSTADAFCATRPVRSVTAPKRRSPAIDHRALRIAANLRTVQVRLAIAVRPINAVAAHLQHLGALARTAHIRGGNDAP